MEYASAAWERGCECRMSLRAMGEISWFAMADILQMTRRNLWRRPERYERWGYDGLVDQRAVRPSSGCRWRISSGCCG
jgi:hypothetical protein